MFSTTSGKRWEKWDAKSFVKIPRRSKGAHFTEAALIPAVALSPYEVLGVRVSCFLITSFC